jgi:hypothetical protein
MTETDLDEPALWGQMIANNGTVDELRFQAREVILAYTDLASSRTTPAT